MNFQNGKRKALIIKQADLPAFCLVLNCLFCITNKDAYLGIADFYFFLVLFIITSLVNKPTIVMDLNTKIIIIMIAWLIVPFLVSLHDGVLSTGYIFSYLVYLFTALLITNADYSRNNCELIYKAYIGAAIIISLWLIIYRYDYYGGGGERHTIKFLGNAALDPNFVGAFLVFPCILEFGRLIKKLNLKDCVYTLIIIIGIIYTSSRGASISIILGMIISLHGHFEGKKGLQRLLVAIILIIPFLYIISVAAPNNSLIRLLSVNSYYDRSNAKRLLDWSMGIKSFIQRPILGFGLRGELSAIHQALNVHYISHNTYIAFLLQFGLLGCVIPFLALCRLLYMLRYNKTILGGIIGVLFCSFFISAETSLIFWMPILYSLILNKVAV